MTGTTQPQVPSPCQGGRADPPTPSSLRAQFHSQARIHHQRRHSRGNCERRTGEFAEQESGWWPAATALSEPEGQESVPCALKTSHRGLNCQFPFKVCHSAPPLPDVTLRSFPSRPRPLPVSPPLTTPPPFQLLTLRCSRPHSSPTGPAPPP